MANEKEWIEAFHHIDKDKNGYLTCNEIEELWKKKGVDPKIAEEIIRGTDKDGDGKISLEEFLEKLRKLPKSEKVAMVWRDVFQHIDKDKSGKVSIKEMEEFCKAQCNDLNMDDLKKWMAENDKDKDGEIDYKEFLLFVHKTYKNH
ncbi:unnamed protein product [Heterobilharzia americana]|nr:unnamed protein product [Heterobilharzia americana]